MTLSSLFEPTTTTIYTDKMVAENENFFDGFEEARAANDVMKFYERKAATYNGTVSRQEVGYRKTTDYAAETLRQHLQESTKGLSVDQFEVLDLGCGSGLTGLSLDQSGFKKFDGVDPSEAMRACAKKYNLYRSVVDGIITETEKLSFPDAKYDGVLCVGCFTANHLGITVGVEEMLRVLKKGGIATYTVSYNMDLVASLQEHMVFFIQKKCELLKIEKRFYYNIADGETVYCNVYSVKKL